MWWKMWNRKRWIKLFENKCVQNFLVQISVNTRVNTKIKTNNNILTRVEAKTRRSSLKFCKTFRKQWLVCQTGGQIMHQNTSFTGKMDRNGIWFVSRKVYPIFYLLFCQSNIGIRLTHEISNRIYTGQQKLNENYQTTTDTTGLNGTFRKSMRYSNSAI